MKDLSNDLRGRTSTDKELREAKNSDNVNHYIYHNKDGRYAWRKLQLVNPYLYISLTNLITESSVWEFIRKGGL